MTKPYQKPEGDEVRSAKWVVPLAAIIAVALALFIGSFVIDNSENQQAVNPADPSSSTGMSTGEGGQGSIATDPDAKANPGAAAAPEKAPQSDTATGQAPAQGR